MFCFVHILGVDEVFPCVNLLSYPLPRMQRDIHPSRDHHVDLLSTMVCISYKIILQYLSFTFRGTLCIAVGLQIANSTNLLVLVGSPPVFN